MPTEEGVRLEEGSDTKARGDDIASTLLAVYVTTNEKCGHVNPKLRTPDTTIRTPYFIQSKLMS